MEGNSIFVVDFVLFRGPLVSLKADEMSNYLVI